MPDGTISERLNYWWDRVMDAKEQGHPALVVTPEEFRALRHLGDDMLREDMLNMLGRPTPEPPVLYGFPVRVDPDAKRKGAD